MQSTFRYDVNAGTAGDAYVDEGTMTFLWEGVPGVTRIIEVVIWDNPAYIRMSYDGITFGPDIEIDPDDPPIQLPHAMRAVEVRNVNAGNNARYQIAGFW